MKPMTRWKPNARGRLQQAAMELYATRGFDETTVAEIAARAGLTERTFFRYFTDKREVLFWGAAELKKSFVGAVTGAAKGLTPLEVVAVALEASAAFFDGRRDGSRARQKLLVAHDELRERELIKLATLGTAIAGALRSRGVAEPAASLTAEAGIAVFKVSFESWLEDARGREFAHHVRVSLQELKTIVSGRKRK
jgi:AcrR family transcriptional regulator